MKAVVYRGGGILLVGLIALASALGMMAAHTDASAVIRRVPLRQNPVAVVVSSALRRAVVVTVGGHHKGGVSVLETRTGHLLTSATTDWNPVAAVISDTSDRMFVVNNGASTLSVLDARRGRLLRTLPLPSAPLALALAVSSQRVFVVWGGPVGGVGILDARSGGVRRVTALSVQAGCTIAVDERTQRVFVASTWSVSVLDAATGALLYHGPLGQSARAMTINVPSGRVFIAGQDATGRGAVSVLDAATGRLLGRTTVDAAPWALGVDERTNRVFVTSPSTGRVDTLDGTSGRLLRRTPTGSQTAALAVDARRGRVFVTDAGVQDRPGHFINSGAVYVRMLDARTGALLRTVPVIDHATATAVAVDDETGHVFVTAVPASGGMDTAASGFERLVSTVRRWFAGGSGQVSPASGSVSMLNISG